MDKYSKKLLKIFIIMLTFFISMILYCAKDVEKTSTRVIIDSEKANSSETIYTKNVTKEEKASNSTKSNKVVNKKVNKKSNNNTKSNSNSNTIKVSNITSNKVDNPTSNNNEEIINNIDKIPVFTFHRLVPDKIKNKYYKNNEWVGSVDIFEQMMKYLHDNNIKTISTLELYDWYMGKVEYNEKVVVITFDDGYLEDYSLAYPILKKYNLKATSFIIGSKVTDKTVDYDDSDSTYSKDPQIFIGQDIIDRLDEEYPNIELQSHSYDLHTKVNVDCGRLAKVYTLTDEELDNDVKQTLKYGFKTMAYPFGLYSDVLQNKLEENGFLLAFTFGGETYDYATRESEQFAMNRIKISGKTTMEQFIEWLNY